MCSEESSCSVNFAVLRCQTTGNFVQKHQLKDWQPGKSSSLGVRKGHFLIFLQFLALKKVT